MLGMFKTNLTDGWLQKLFSRGGCLRSRIVQVPVEFALVSATWQRVTAPQNTRMHTLMGLEARFCGNTAARSPRTAGQPNYTARKLHGHHEGFWTCL